MVTTHDEVLTKMLDLNQALIALYNACDDKESMLAASYLIAAREVKSAYEYIILASEYQQRLY